MDAKPGTAPDADPGAEALHAIRARLGVLSEDASLLVEEGFRARSEAMDILESGILAPLTGSLSPSRGPNPLAALRNEAERLLERWESLDTQLFRRLRAMLRASPDPGAAFRDLLQSYFPARDRRESAAPAGYDALDAFLNGLLHPWPIPAESRPLEPGMVAYQKTPARIALDLIARSGLGPADSLCDVGSGLGQIPILAHLLTGARTMGIEREPAYVDYARACAADLGLSAAEFLSADAREADYAAFDVLFFYTPFRGPILAEVLDRVRRQGREGMRVFAFGPCIAELAHRDWLKPLESRPVSGPGLEGFVLRKAY